MTAADIAERLHVAVPTVRVFIARDGLPARKVGRSYRFIESEVDAWVRERDTSRVASGPDHPHRDAIRRLVETAPELTAAQVDRIAAILNGGN
ncbi:helix-turn-helix domain-containing protein [Rhodococcus hoagii]|nr:helix-turn-helix domain-containing protein [Prescottella equi]